jgi:hypothetical protein
MKAFIVATLLVASVAAQGIDVYDVMKMKNLHNLRRWNEPSVEDLLLKEKLGGGVWDYDTRTNMGRWGHRDSIYGDEDIDTDILFGGRGRVGSYLTLEELVSHPLFREYLRLPLFHQFWEEHPTVFRKYVESPLFQRFWTVPTFRMYFRNPVLFYKYIVPQVHMIKKYITEGVYNYDFDYDTTSTSRYLPYVLGRHMETRPWTRSNTNLKYILQRMMNHLNVKPITETVTDVKVYPNGEIKEQTVGKVVDQITGIEKINVGDIKTVDQRIVPRFGLDNLDIPTMTSTLSRKMKDALLKHFLIQRLLKKTMLPTNVYSHLFEDNEELMNVPEITRMIMNRNQITIPTVLESLMERRTIHPQLFDLLFGTKKHLFTPRMFENIFDVEGTKMYTPEIYQHLFGGVQTLRPEIFEPVFGRKMYIPEVYSTLFGDMVEDEVAPLYKYNPFAYRSKMVNPIVTRMLLNKYNKESELDNIMTAKVIKDMKTEKLIKDAIETEVPEMMERKMMHRVPLVMGMPLTGSNIEEILKEKNEIKF